MYISSACVKHEKIKDSIEELARNGFVDIELSGGTKYYEGYEDDLLKLKDKYNLNYLLHNYFPPPKEEFILNLASLNNDIYQKSIQHCERALALSKKLGSKKFGFHAGYFIDIATKEIGKNISRTSLFDKGKAVERFCQGYQHLKGVAGDVELYLENNVLSSSNAKTFQGENPLMLTDYRGYVELKTFIDFKLLLDVAHLNVSATTLGLDFVEQLEKLLLISDYVHLSDNDGSHDQARCFNTESKILDILKAHDFTDKIITTETYGAISDIKLSQLIIKRSLGIKG